MSRQDNGYQEALAEALATTDVLQRVAGTVAIHLYQLELRADGSYDCLAWVGAGLERLLGPIPDEVNEEEAWESAVHPDDRGAYDAGCDAVQRGEPVEVEYRLVGYDGRVRWVWDRMHPYHATDGRLLVDGIVADITERREVADELARMQEQLAHLAYHDALTDLPNRLSFQDHLGVAISRCELEEAALAVLFVDLDNFKLVNDSFGHAAGDELLRAVAGRLRRSTRSIDVVARQGGDEFLILVGDIPRSSRRPRDAQDVRSVAEVVAQKLRRVLAEPFTISGVEIFVSASVGVSLYPIDATDSETLLKHADVAMYRAKESGRDAYELYAGEGEDALAQLSMAGRLRGSVERAENLVLHYQPLVELESAKVVGVEALIRWQDGDRLVPPADFIPIAERTGLMARMSDWVIGEACRQATIWRDEGLDLYVSVNLPPTFWQPTAMRHVLATIEAFGLNPDRMMIEITESAVVSDQRPAMDSVLDELHARGLQLAIDDFGTGHSSLSRLNQMRVTTLKIDRSFVRDLPADRSADVVVTSIVQLAHNLGLRPLAEGIETDAQRRFLLEHGCRLGQGFLFSRPVPADDIPRLCRG